MHSLKLALFAAGVAFAAGAAPLTLVENGSPTSTIVLSSKPTRSAQLAAFELQHVVKLITGAELPIIHEPSSVKGTAIYVGTSDGLSALGLNPEKYETEEYEVRTLPQAIALAGNDSPDFGKVDYGNAHTFPKVSYTYHSTLYAVYDFLEKRCGARFYMPGDLGTCVKTARTLSVEPLDIRRKPSMEGIRLSTLSVPWRKKHQSTERDRALLAFRWRMCEFYGLAHHNTFGLYFRYWKKSETNKFVSDCFVAERPDMFAQGYQGKSSGTPVFPNDHDLPPNICYTNPDTIRVLAEQAVRTANGEVIPWTAGGPKVPGMPYYTYPMLGEDNSEYCKCENCQKLAPPGITGTDRNTWIYYGFINALCREVAKRDPSIYIASGVYQLPMQDVPLENNMSLMLMFGVGTWYLPGVYDRHQIIYDYWRNKAGKRPVTLWLYLLAPYWDMWINENPKKLFPGFYPNKIAPIARKFVNDGIAGWFSETFIDYSYLETYVGLNICYDSSFPAEKEVADFFPNFFGAAGEPMREYWQIVEDAYWNPSNYSKSVRERYTGVLNIWTHTDDVNWGVGTRERVDRLDTLFRKAQAAAVTPLEKKRLAFIDETIHRQMVEGRNEYERRANLRSVPPPHVFVRRGTNAVARIGKTLDNKPAATGCTVGLTHDFKSLVFVLEDDTAYAGNLKGEDEWANNVELFFAENGTDAYPFNHFILTPQGKCRLYRHYDQNGVVKFGEFKTSAKYSCKVTPDGKWSFRLEIPFTDVLPEGEKTVAAGNTEFRMNMFRTRGPDRICWGPTFAAGYLCDPGRLGRIVLGGSLPTKVESIGADFRAYKRPTLLDKQWQPAGNDDPKVKLVSGVGLQLTAPVILRSLPRTPVTTGNTAVFRLRATCRGKDNRVRVSWHENLSWDKTWWLYKEAVGSQIKLIPESDNIQETELRFPVPALAGSEVTHMTFWLWCPFENSKLTVESLQLEIE